MSGPRLRRATELVATAMVGCTVLSCGSGAEAAPFWGYRGHEMATRAAVEILPEEMPAFFREAADQLAYLSPEPDRWRIVEMREMDRAWDFDHYIDLENVPEAALSAPDRFTYLRALYDADLARPERDGGFLPFRIVELHQRLVSLWARWHEESSAERRRFIEARIIDDAGILSHYVTDASQPHHTTIHFDGWAPDAPNPEGFSEARGFHGRFETRFVNAHVTLDDVRRHLPSEPRSVVGSARAGVLDFIQATHAELETLYRLDRDVGFDPAGTPDPIAKRFTSERLAAGAEMLATLWWSAFLEGGGGPGG